MKEIYTSGGSGYDRTEMYDLFKQFGTRTLFSTPPKGPHSQRKRILADRYANTNIMRSETLSGLQKRAAMFLENCLSTQGHDPDVYVYLHCFALDGATQHLFAQYGTNSLGDPEDMEIVKEMTYHDSLKKNWSEYYVPKLAAMYGKLNFMRPRAAPLANTYVLNTCKKSGAAEYSLLSKLQSKASELEELSAPAECMDHLAAGIDTTGDGLCFLMHQLSLPGSQEIQTRLRKELRENAEVAFDQLPYLDAVVKEGLRCFPPIPMSFPRYVPSGGKTLDGYFIPAHTIVSCQPYTLHKDEKVFPGPLRFKPERWLAAEGEVERNRMFFAFSQGSRGCIGKHLAMAEMKILLKEVYSQCRTTVSPEMNGDMSMADQIISSRPKGQTCQLAFERIAV
ncbi:hypothetical protein MBLNU459_g2168t1 [Dothideomycetes sp. NU459]